MHHQTSKTTQRFCLHPVRGATQIAAHFSFFRAINDEFSVVFAAAPEGSERCGRRPLPDAAQGENEATAVTPPRQRDLEQRTFTLSQHKFHRMFALSQHKFHWIPWAVRPHWETNVPKTELMTDSFLVTE